MSSLTNEAKQKLEEAVKYADGKKQEKAAAEAKKAAK